MSSFQFGSSEAAKRSGSDAAKMKHHIADLKYTTDSFAYLLRPRAAGLTSSSALNSPLINRGYFARVSTSTVNVVEMGAGFSTLYLRAVSGETSPPLPSHSGLKFYEVDFEDVLNSKKSALCTPLLSSSLPPLPNFHAADLSAPNFSSSFKQEIDSSAPTLFIFEAVLMYMDRTSSDNLLSDIASSFPDATVVIYDPILQKTRFGTTMCENLRRSGVEVSGMLSLRTLEDQLGRLKSVGFSASHGLSMLSVFSSVLTSEQRA
eukprot:CAMPEP_0118653694 /NCGR_PEP_ID=MMETSP0785-20121206/11962_1 /TAXON_ID=91992 /ORGANISM="Bolidomonas pacifica, Strain CCMP 1866" /LENGTH=261 /DNA_ID=CAMNT_0006546243 /DNA_START=126 /DNA_END=907 /DNA_ORIENTATION=-